MFSLFTVNIVKLAHALRLPRSTQLYLFSPFSNFHSQLIYLQRSYKSAGKIRVTQVRLWA